MLDAVRRKESALRISGLEFCVSSLPHCTEGFVLSHFLKAYHDEPLVLNSVKDQTNEGRLRGICISVASISYTWPLEFIKELFPDCFPASIVPGLQKYEAGLFPVFFFFICSGE